MEIKVTFFSYCRELAGCAELTQAVAPGSTLGDLVSVLGERLPKLQAMRGSLLTAVGVEYQKSGYVLQEGDEVTLFPPVQGG